MKKILSFLLLLSALACQAQTFEGVITYTNYLVSKTPAMSNKQLNDMMGTRFEYFYKPGVYKSVTNGSATQWQLYVPAENRVYTKTANSENLVWTDASQNRDEVLKSELHKNAIKIAGYDCDKLVLSCRSGTQTYYFSKKLGVNAELFKNHHYGNWYAFLKLAGALALKTVIETPQFRLESTATEVKPMKLQPDLFKLPAQPQRNKSQ